MTKITEDIIAAQKEYDLLLQESIKLISEEDAHADQLIRDAKLKWDAAKLDAIEQTGITLEQTRLVPTNRIAMKISHDFKGLIEWREVREICRKLERTNWIESK
jgi:hypothetical protein